MNSIEHRIQNSHLITDIFGYWPSFHDAEVISFEMFRGARDLNEPVFRAKLHVFEMTKEVDGRGFFVLKDHTEVTFLFRGIDESYVKWFNQQNALQELAIIDICSRQLEKLEFEVHFVSAFGVEAEFKCKSIEIQDVMPMEPQNISFSPRGSAAKLEGK
jgi:Immunity protein 50